MKDYEKLNGYILNNDNQKAKEIINSGLDVNWKNDASDRICSIFTEGHILCPMPLYTACKAGNLEMIHFLLDNGANPMLTNYGLEYPLEIFLRTNYEVDATVVEHMIEVGVDVNQALYMSPLVLLAERYNRVSEPEHKKTLQQEIIAIVEAGGNWINDKKTKFEGYSILHFVACSEDVDFMKQLLSYKQAKQYIDLKDIERGNTPIELAHQFQREEMESLLRAQI